MAGPAVQSHSVCHADLVRKTVNCDNAAAHSLIVASWRRSLHHHGLLPETTRSPHGVTERELCEARGRMGKILQLAQPTLDQLFKTVGATGACVLLTDRAGIVVDHRDRLSERNDFKDCGLRTGGDWSEAVEGTNGIGTCLMEERPVAIHQGEHFLSRNTALTCVDAPIFDEYGNLAAALNISSFKDTVTKAFVLLIANAVKEAARKIEICNFHAAFPDARIILCDEHGMAGSMAGASLIASDRDDLVIGATRAARKALGITGRKVPSVPTEDILRGKAHHSDLQDAERAELRRALARTGGNVSAAAKMLGIGRATLYRRMKRLKVSV